MNTVIAISREYGSGGRKIGKLLAKHLNIPFYDKELIVQAAEKGGFSQDIIGKYDEKAIYQPIHSYSYQKLFNFYHKPLTGQMYLAQYNLVKELASKGSCVIIGRCADDILEGKCISVFVYADIKVRMERKFHYEHNISQEIMKDRIFEIDRQRKSYYEYHTGRKWGDKKNYHLCIDSSHIGPATCGKLIIHYMNHLNKGEENQWIY